MLKLLFIIPSCLTIFIFALFLMIISSSSDMNLLNNKNFLLPFSADTPYQLTSGFGWRRDPFDQTDDFHQGIDLATNKGTNILASASGTAYIVSNNKWYGNYIVLKHHFSNSVYYTFYMHLLDDSFQVKENEIVEQGQTIGLVGSSGDSTGYHLHFSILKDKYIFDAEHLVDPSFVLENHVQD